MLSVKDIKNFKDAQPITQSNPGQPVSFRNQPKYMSIEATKDGLAARGMRDLPCIKVKDLDELTQLVREYFTDIKI